MYQVQLNNFEGPLDLLLYFIRRDKIDIYDIPIAKITAEYITALEMMRNFNITVAGEFIEMAATLMRIKARMLLPAMSTDEEGEIEDPRTELVRRIVEYQQFKETARELDLLADEWHRQFPRTIEMQFTDESEDPSVYLREISLYDIAHYFKLVMDRMPVIKSYELQGEPISLEDQKMMIMTSFDKNNRLLFSTLVEKLRNKIEIIITFLAVLELIRVAQVKVTQSKLFGELEMKKLIPKA